MGLFKKFKKAVKKGVKGAGGRVAPAVRLTRAVGKVALKKSTPRRLRKFISGRTSPAVRIRKLARPPIKGRKALKGRAKGMASPLRRRRRTRSK